MFRAAPCGRAGAEGRRTWIPPDFARVSSPYGPAVCTDHVAAVSLSHECHHMLSPVSFQKYLNVGVVVGLPDTGSSFIHLCADVQLSQHHVLKRVIQFQT